MSEEEIKIIDEIGKQLSELIEKRKELRANEVQVSIVDGKITLGEEVRERLGCGEVLIRIPEGNEYAYISKVMKSEVRGLRSRV